MSKKYQIEELEVDPFSIPLCSRAFFVHEGGIEEESGFRLLMQHKVESTGNVESCAPCRHATDLVISNFRYRENGPDYIKTEWVVPRAVEAFNEGGHASTVICLDCAIEAAEEAAEMAIPS